MNILNFLKENPGSIAKEINVHIQELYVLEESGRIVRSGKRQTGKRGRPPVEWSLTGDAEAIAKPEKKNRDKPEINATEKRQPMSRPRTGREQTKLDNLLALGIFTCVREDERLPIYEFHAG